MLGLSDRCTALRNDAVSVKSHVTRMELERLRHYINGIIGAPRDKQSKNAYLIAAGTASVIRNICVLIQEGELIVGHNYGLKDWFPHGWELSRDWLKNNRLTDNEADELIKGWDTARFLLENRDTAPPLARQTADQMEDMAICGYPMYENHTVLGYEKVLRLGFKGILQHAQRCARQNQDNDWYDSVKLVCAAACEIGDRYAAQAEELIARGSTSGQRKKELRRISKVCRQVPRKPARTFYEAVQSLWFAHMINTWEDGVGANSLGRLDQILYPYYQADIEKGVLTGEEAFEIICCLWIKLYRGYDVQQSCVGGCDRQGRPAVNDLSYLMLDATEALGFIRCLSVRFSGTTDKAFIQRALEVVGRVQKGIPFFFNDDVLIPALVDQGIPLEDARDYTQIGCVETVIPGKSNPHAVSARANFLKAMEYTLNNGGSKMRPDLAPGLEAGDPEGFGTFEELKIAVYNQIRHLINNAYVLTIRAIPDVAVNEPRPYKSLLTEGCLENGRDFNDRGAVYDYYQMMFFGIPNLADSLAAVNELVYKRRKYTMGQLVYQLKNNFPDEAIRLDFLNNAPKFGNDIEEADRLAAEIMEVGCDCLKDLSNEYGYVFQAQPFTFVWMIDHGRATAATPDGRRDGEIMAYSVSPMQGRDFNGLTAVINSLSRLPAKKASGTASAIVEADPELFTDQNIPYLADILLAGAQKGLSNVQFNAIDAQTLMDAQKHPENTATSPYACPDTARDSTR